MSAELDVLVDASAVMEVILDRPEKKRVIDVIDRNRIVAPQVISYEIGNALTSLKKRHLINELEVMNAYDNFKRLVFDYQLEYQEVFIDKALIIACRYWMYAYDAYYLEVATRQNLPILTFDNGMKRVARDLKLTVLEV